MPLCTEIGLGPGDIVLDGDPAPHLKGAQPPPQFLLLSALGSTRKYSASYRILAHVYCGQTAGWIKMPLGTEVGLGPGYIVLDGDPAALPARRGKAPIFGPCLLWPNGLIDQDATWYGDWPWPRRHCVRWGPASA